MINLISAFDLLHLKGSHRLLSTLFRSNVFRNYSSKIVPDLPSHAARTTYTQEENDYIQRFQQFIDHSTDPFHAIDSIKSRLEKENFQLLAEDEIWKSRKLRKNGKYYFLRNGSSIVAFIIGGKYELGNGWKILGAHTDSPNLKIKPNSKRTNNQGNMKQLNVECYGGGLWHTWFDRDLSISGRVIVKDSSRESFRSELVKISRPIVRIPNLCIHLRSADEREAFKINKEEHLQPVLCDIVHNALLEFDNSNISDSASSSWEKHQEPLLLQLIAKELSVSLEDIMDFELSLFDTQISQRTGLFQEFLCSSRIDNLASCFTLLESFLSHNQNSSRDEGITVLALFDHEEVGSESAIGAGSSLIGDTIARLNQHLFDSKSDFTEGTTFNAGQVSVEEIHHISKARSFILSVDMAHAVHPNYASKHDKSHSPLMNHGIVIKSNVNQRYSTSGITGFLTREIARRANVPVQEFSVRNDCPCGSTIGPILSANTGIKAVDVGMPQLSMHSIREMMGVNDLLHAHLFFNSFLREYHQLQTLTKL